MVIVRCISSSRLITLLLCVPSIYIAVESHDATRRKQMKKDGQTSTSRADRDE